MSYFLERAQIHCQREREREAYKVGKDYIHFAGNFSSRSNIWVQSANLIKINYKWSEASRSIKSKVNLLYQKKQTNSRIRNANMAKYLAFKNTMFSEMRIINTNNYSTNWQRKGLKKRIAMKEIHTHTYTHVSDRCSQHPHCGLNHNQAGT